MVKKKNSRYTMADWRRDNPVEADILDLIGAAHSYADSLVPYSDAKSDDPDCVLVRADDKLTELELAIHRGTQAIRLMMGVAQARKVAGLKKMGRGKDKSYDPLTAKLSDPQVQVVLEMLREEKTKEAAYTEVAGIISPGEKIDQRTLKHYIETLSQCWGYYANPDLKPFWVDHSDT